LARPDKTSAIAAVKDPRKKMMYICSKGRAFRCKLKTAGKYDAMACFKAGAKDPLADNGTAWEMIRGVIGKVQPKFEKLYPDCLVPRAMREQEDTAKKSDATHVGANKVFAQKIDMSMPLTGLVEIMDTSKPPKGTGKYKTMPMKGIYVDKWGGLCTNMKTQTSFEMQAFLNSIKDSMFSYTARLTKMDKSTDVKAKKNVVNAKTHLTEEMFNKLTKNQDGQLLKYYDFLIAVSYAPMFCGSEGAGFYRDLPQSAICRKELAAFFATAITFTNKGSKADTADKTDPTTKKVTKGKPYSEQGFAFKFDQKCKTSSACKNKLGETEKTGNFKADGLCKGKCSTSANYYARGPGKL